MEYNAISFFSGAMGLDLGMERAGIKVRLVNDNDKYCCETIRTNRPDLALIDRPIEEISTREILKTAGLKKSEVFLVFGGPPCQAFSTAGGRKSLRDTRGNCILEFVKKVDEIKPRYFVMENVRGLLSAAIDPGDKASNSWSNDPARLPGSAIRYIAGLFRDAGYVISFALFDSANYGVPQIRERVIMFGNRGKKRVPLPQPTHSQDGKQTGEKWVTLREAFKRLNGTKHHHLNFSENKLMYYKMLKAGQYWKHLPKELQEKALGPSYHLGGGKTGFYRRLAWSKPAPTLCTRPNMPATDLCHPTKLRPLSVEEYKVIQQFPNNWKLAGNITEQYRQIGNAVPVGLGYMAGKTIIDFHEGKITKEKANGINYSRYRGTTDYEVLQPDDQLELQYQ